MEFFYPVVKFFTAGGAFMFPILLVGAVALAITIERYISLSRMGARILPRIPLRQAEPGDSLRSVPGRPHVRP